MPILYSWGDRFSASPQRAADGPRVGPVCSVSDEGAGQSGADPVGVYAQMRFVGGDLPRAVFFQIALMLLDGVRDPEGAGIRVIHLDGPALREGLPLRHAARAAYLHWSVDAFRLASSVASDETQIEIESLIEKRWTYISSRTTMGNPDCGLKTRR